MRQDVGLDAGSDPAFDVSKGVNLILAARRSLPVFRDEQTFSDTVGMSQAATGGQNSEPSAAKTR